VIERYEKRFGVVESAQELRATRERAMKVLADWKSPVLQLAPGLRSLTLTEEEAARLESGALPRLKVTPRPL
jgi:hypothetical protein